MRRLAIALVVLAAACGTPATSATPTPREPLTAAELNYRVVAAVGRPWFCDPDFYPIARADEAALAAQRFPEIERDAQAYRAILAHLGLQPGGFFTADQRLAIYRDWKMLNALRLEPSGTRFAFQIRVMDQGAKSATLVDGSVDQFGDVRVDRRVASGPPNCPICLARGTRIATPNGEARVEDLRRGDVVWTLDPAGRRVAAPVLELGDTPVPEGHEVVDLVLDDGRELLVSPGHPTADGGRVGELAPGDPLDGTRVIATSRVRYEGSTFDLLPAGATGLYWANGVLLGSTLRR